MPHGISNRHNVNFQALVAQFTANRPNPVRMNGTHNHFKAFGLCPDEGIAKIRKKTANRRIEYWDMPFP